MKTASLDQELEALKTVLHALEPLNDTQRAFVLKTAAERMSVPAVPGAKPVAGGQPPAHGARGDAAAAGSPGSAASTPDDQTPKQFLKIKMPKTDVQRIACLAYYLTHVRKQSHFKTEDLTKLNTEAGGTPISNPSMAVANATKQNAFLSRVGGAKKQITALGEDVVTALPDQEAVKATVANYRKPRKRKAKKTKARTT